MRNPFEYGGVVSGEAFCNREKELGDLLRPIENAEKLFVFSERRYVKQERENMRGRDAVSRRGLWFTKYPQLTRG